MQMKAFSLYLSIFCSQSFTGFFLSFSLEYFAENCLLTTEETKSLSSQSLYSDSSWDIYEQLSNAGKCADSIGKSIFFNKV